MRGWNCSCQCGSAMTLKEINIRNLGMQPRKNSDLDEVEPTLLRNRSKSKIQKEESDVSQTVVHVEI